MKNENASCWFKIGMLFFVLVAVLGCAALAHADTVIHPIACTYTTGYTDHISINTTEGFNPTLTTKIGSSTTKPNPTIDDLVPMTYELSRIGKGDWYTSQDGISIELMVISQGHWHMRVKAFGNVSDADCVRSY